MSVLNFDHAYARHWSEHFLTNTSHVLPLKQLLHLQEDDVDYTALKRKQGSSPSLEDAGDSAEESDDVEIDVESIPVSDLPSSIGSVSWHCAEQKARMQMNECERHVASTRKMSGLGSSSVEDDECLWENNINKSQWNAMTTKLFNKTVKILHDEKLARLSCKGSKNELVFRRLSLDDSACRFRNALAEAGWQVKLTQWLHILLLETLPATLLSYYLDITQTLRSQVPHLVEKMIMPSREAGSACSERMAILSKRPWDPAVTAVVSNTKQLQKLNHSVLFIVVQCNASNSSVPTLSRRCRFWNTMLSQIGKVVFVTSASEANETGKPRASQTVRELAENMLNTVCKKVRELSSRSSNRKIILIGWHVASMISCHVALAEKVAAVVCLGFPLYTMFGQRGSVDDVLCDLTTPTLFVVGNRASYCGIDDLEDAREKTFTEAITSAVIVCGADDWLRVSERRKKRCAVTQSMVDRLILESICDFLHTIFLSPDKRYEYVQQSLDPQHAHLKRSHSISDFPYYNNKRPRSMSPQSVLKKSTTSAQLNQLLSHQKDAAEEGDSRLQGLSFNLQTGSVSGLTSLPRSVSERRRRNTSSSSSKSLKSANNKSATESTSSSSRSITIDITKDPKAQLSSALSKRKTQLLQPTESQTEAAIAAILGGGAKKKNGGDSSNVRRDETVSSYPGTATVTSSMTAVMSPSSNIGRYAMDAATASGGLSSSISKSDLSSFTPVLGSNTSSSLQTPVDDKKPLPRKNLKQTQPSLNQFTTIDQSSVIFSRTHREERETQQATAILEQLASGVDPGSRSASPDPSQTRGSRIIGAKDRASDVQRTVKGEKASIMKEKRKGKTGSTAPARIDSSRRHTHHSFPASHVSSTIPNTSRGRATRVRTRGGRRGTAQALSRSSSLMANKQTAVSTPDGKPSVVRYVLTSSGLTGVLASRGGSARHFTLFPEQGAHSQGLNSIVASKPLASKVFPSGSKKLVFCTKSGVAKSAAGQSKIGSEQGPSSTPLVDMILESASTKKDADTMKRKGAIGTLQRTFTPPATHRPVTSELSSGRPQPTKNPLLKAAGSKSVLYVQDESSTKSGSIHTFHPIVNRQKDGAAQGNKQVPKVITAKSGERTLLSITRPRAVSSGSLQSSKAATVSRAASDGKMPSLRVPSVMLTKLTNDAAVKTEAAGNDATSKASP